MLPNNPNRIWKSRSEDHFSEGSFEHLGNHFDVEHLNENRIFLRVVWTWTWISKTGMSADKNLWTAGSNINRSNIEKADDVSLYIQRALFSARSFFVLVFAKTIRCTKYRRFVKNVRDTVWSWWKEIVLDAHFSEVRAFAQKCVRLHKSALVEALLFEEQLVMLRVFSHSGGPFSKTAPFHEFCSIKIFTLVWKMERAERNARWKFQVYWNSVFNPPGYTVTDRRFEKANGFFKAPTRMRYDGQKPFSPFSRFQYKSHGWKLPKVLQFRKVATSSTLPETNSSHLTRLKEQKTQN